MRPFATCFFTTVSTLFVTAVLLLASWSAQAQIIRYVTPTGTSAPASATTSWATSTTDLQGAINASAASDEVWVAAGKYKPGGSANLDQTISFALKNGVTVLGGFPATGSPTMAQRNPRTHTTTLSGDLDNDGTLAGNSYHIFFLPDGLGINTSAILDGFELTGGNAANLALIDTELQAVQGGAAYVGDNSPLFQNCVFRGNRAGGCGTYGCYGYGGAIGNSGGNPGFINCTFTNNSTVGDGGQGGVVYSSNGSPGFTNCSFQGNSSQAGGVYYESSVPIRFMNCSFQGNSSVNDGFVGVTNFMNSPNTGATITNSVFWNNGGSRAFTYYDAAQPVLSHSLLEPGSDAAALLGPGIRYASASPYTSTTATTLTPCSEAIGNADVTSYATLFGGMANAPQTDELGNARFRSGTLDMGARQYNGALTALLTLVSQPPASTVATVNTAVSATFSVTSVGAINYGWYRDNALVSGQTSATLSIPTVQFTDTGQYVSVASTSGGCSLSSTAFQLNVLPVYNLNITVAANPSFTVTQGTTTTLTASGATSYTWGGPTGTGFVGNPLIVPVNTTTVFSVSGLTGINGGITSLTVTTVPVACRSTIYVTENGTGAQTGADWANAMAGRNLQLAINAAQACGGQVWVASGTYKPTTDNNRAVSFSMKPGVAIYGGFAGGETSLSQRPALGPNNGQPSSSTLSGDIGVVGTSADNSFHVIFNNPGLTPTSVLDGFVVTGGRADVFGGGMFNNGQGAGNMCSPTVRNCSFIDNAAIYGGGVWNQANNTGVASPRFENTYFERNLATALGGAFYNQPDPSGITSATLINCGFVNNSATDGGAIYNNGYNGGRAFPLLLNCAFINNTATRGGAMFTIGFGGGRAVATVVNSSFHGNTATGSGGAIFNSPVSGTAGTVLTNSVLWNNAAGGPGGSAALTPASTFTANTSLLEANVPNGTGNFVAGASPFTASGSVSLNSCAPAIGAGDISAYNAAGGPGTDWVGNARLRSGVLDMGAQQFVGTLGGAVTITSQPPSSLTLNAGDDVSVPISASSNAALSYQWFRNGAVLSGQTSATLSIPQAQTTDSGTHVVSVSATGGCSTTSTALQLTIAPSNNPVLTITTNPSATVTAGVMVTLTVSGATSYTWANGTQGSTFVFVPTATTAISVMGTNALGFTGSTTRTITVVPIPCQSIIYVTPNGAGDQTGTNWTNAIAGRNLQPAINVAQGCGAQVWVASGTYKPTGTPDRSDANRAISFSMRPGVKLYGGFVGTETTLSQRPALNPTLGQVSSSTLSGEIGDPNSTTDNSYHVILNGNGITNTDILDGFVVSGGYATDAGGGMYNNANQVTLSNARWVCSPTIRNVLFTNNFAPLGGAIFNDSRVQGRTNPYLENTSFVSNTATLGGAIMNFTYNYGNANWRAVNCRFERNVAMQGGAIYSNGDAGGEANYVLINSVFKNNTATTTGGVAYNYARLVGVVSPSYVNCSFFGNSNVNYNDQSVAQFFTPGTTLPTFNNCAFWNNGGAGSMTASGQAPFVYNSSLEPGTTYINGTGNVVEVTNPFSSTVTLQLNPCAQAVNLADPNGYTAVTGGVPPSPTTDAAGNPRYFNSGPLDAGAFELQQAAGARPVIVSQPVAATIVRAPAPIRLPMSSTSTVGMTYQWYKNGTVLSGQTSATLSIPSSQTTDAGSYSVVVTSADGCSLTSTASNVTVRGEFDLDITVLPSTTVTFGAPTTLVASGSTSYTWSTGATTAQIVDYPTVTTVYSVTGRSTSGIVNTTSITVTVLPLPCNTILHVTETGAGTRDGSSWANAVAGQNLQAALFEKLNCGGGQVWVARGTYKPTQTTNRAIYFQALNGVSVLGGFVGNETDISQRPAVNPRTGNASGSILSGEIGDPNSTTDNAFHVVFHPIGTNSSAVLDGFVITGGYAPDFGGGLLNYATYVSGQPTMDPSIHNCLFINNYAPLGGAVANVDNRSYANVTPTFSNCVFRQNTAINGGAVANLSADVIGGKEGVKATFTDCTFSQNTAQTDGGAVYNANNVGLTAAGNAEPRFVNCLFRDNQAASMGGAIRVFASLPSVVARSVAGGQWINCGFVGNRAQYGGGLGSTQSGGTTLLSFVNSSFQSNTATVAGGALWAGEFNFGSAYLYVINSAFWGNGAGSLGAQSGDNGKILVTNSLLESGGGNYTATNSLTATASPFVSTTSVETAACSEAVGLADVTSYTNAIVAGPATDLTGNPRFVGARLDAGAAQYQGVKILPLAITAQPVAATALCVGTALNVPVSVSGTGPITYQWYKEGLSLGAAQSTSALSFSSVRVSDAGTYSVVAVGTCNSVTSTAFSLTVNTLPAPTLLASATLTCAKTSLTLTATGGTSYSFVGTGLVSQNALAATAVVNAPGTYTVVAANAAGCISTTTTEVFSNTLAPVVGLAASGMLTCAVKSLTLTATSSVSGTSFAFAGPGASTPGLISQNAVAGTAVVNQSGTYSVTATNSANGCFSTTNTTVSSNTTPPTATLTASNAAVCAPGSITLTAGGGTTYAFAGPSLSQSGVLTIAIVSQSGTYSVVVTNVVGCTATATRSVTVNAQPAAPTLTGTNSPVPVSSTPLSLTAYATATPPNILAFLATTGPLNPPNADISLAGVQAFSAIQTSPQGCTSPAAVFSLTVLSPLPPASQTLCRGSQVVLPVLPGGTRYEWYKNGQTAANKLLDVLGVQRGTTASSLTLVSVQTNASFYAKTFAADGSFSWSGPFALVIGNCANGRIGQVENTPPLAINLAPNPLENNQLQATITGAEGQPLTVQLVDLLGRMIRQETWQYTAQKQSVSWEVSVLLPGVYLLQAISNNQHQRVKVIKP
ncbi:T9SS type A sorting domain-containing protein [Fibrella aquatilis]|uniref:T9SS type A sorting domain-containing protein n=1 Tax=Fibrella aquatilis TaxID=2817059 RepID=A0A939K368_9BACT|nr:T9SS type A sorting domain-containing protein [Fibrella aquatilis]MBO0934045.1 T9SS type A sorting domain-containing protein [Fibrella aquatilis]